MPDHIEASASERAQPRERVEDALAEITALLRRLRLVEGLLKEQQAETRDKDSVSEHAESLVTRQNKAELIRKLDRLHAADIAYLLEALPRDERLYIWNLVRASRDGEILLEVSEPVRESLISSMDTEELVAATEALEADEIAELAPDLPQEVLDDLFQSLPIEEREQLRAAMSFDDDMVGALMDFEDVHVRPDVTLEVVLRYLRRFDELPTQTDQVFVVDRDEKLLGVLPLNRLIVTDPDTLVEKERLAQGRLREEEDVFASVWKSFQNRWAWLAINLVTAFIASRVNSVFENSLQKLVALAALM